MKFSNYNKFGGTEFRTKRQINAHLTLINWIKENVDLIKNKQKKEIENLFIDFCKKEGLYNYNKKSPIKRFDMIISNLKIDLKIIDEKYAVSEKFDFDDPINSFFNFMIEAFPESDFPFKKMVNFLFENKDKKLSAKKIFFAFSVYDGKESIEEIYNNENILENKIKEKMTNFDFKKNFNEIFSGDFSWRKPPNSIKAMKKIYFLKQENKKISKTILNEENYDFSKDKYIKKIVSNNDVKREKLNINELINRINMLSISEYVEKIIICKIKTLLEKEYFDLFNRWMFDLSLADSSSNKIKNYVLDNLFFKEKTSSFIIKIKNYELNYPFSFEDCQNVLEKINDKKWIEIRANFEEYNDYLNDVNNSTIAEYFVNLFFLYKFKIEPKDAHIWCHTKLTRELLPIFTAPGGGPDMHFVSKDCIYVIETTILESTNSIINNECNSIKNHVKKFDTSKEKKLFFIMLSKNFNKRKHYEEIKEHIEMYFIKFISNVEFEILYFNNLQNVNY